MIWYDTTEFLIIITTGLLGVICGILGTFLMLQKKSLFADTMAHATLPGMTGIFLYTQHCHYLVFIAAGCFSALFAASIIEYIQRHSHLHKETIFGIIVSTFFGLGIIFLSKIQTTQTSSIHFQQYLLGNASMLLNQDCAMLVFLTVVVIALTMLAFCPIKIQIFDPTFAIHHQTNHYWIQKILLILTTITIVAGASMVGVILMSALLITPACSAAQWSNQYHVRLILAPIIGFLSALCANMYCFHINQTIPTGPAIIICGSIIMIISLFFAPHGIIPSWWKHKQAIQKIDSQTTLQYFLLFNEGLKNPEHAHNLAALQALGKNVSPKMLKNLEAAQLIHSPEKNFWHLTAQGVQLLKKQQDAS